MPAYVMAYAYTDFLQYAGPVQTSLREAFGWTREDYWFPEIRSVPGAAAMFVFTLYPYVFLLARTAFLERSPALIEAARTLGLDRRARSCASSCRSPGPRSQAASRSRSMETLADFGTVAYFAVDTFTTGIYRAWFSLGDRTAAAQLAAMLLLFVVAAVAVERASRGEAHDLRQRASAARRRARAAAADGTRAWLATTVCAIPLLAGFVMPVLLLLRLVGSEGEPASTARYALWSYNSLRVALLAAVLAVAIAIVVAYARRLAPGASRARASAC